MHLLCTQHLKNQEALREKKEHISIDGSLQPEVGLSRERSNGKKHHYYSLYSIIYLYETGQYMARVLPRLVVDLSG